MDCLDIRLFLLYRRFFIPHRKEDQWVGGAYDISDGETACIQRAIGGHLDSKGLLLPGVDKGIASNLLLLFFLTLMLIPSLPTPLEVLCGNSHGKVVLPSPAPSTTRVPSTPLP